MGWIAVTGEGAAWVREDWAGAVPGRLLTRGTLMVEVRLGAPDRPRRLLSLERAAPWPASLSLTALPGEGLALVITQGAEVVQSVLPLPADRRDETLRITFAWDSPARWGRLAAEGADGRVLAWQEIGATPPLTAGDLAVLPPDPPGVCALSETVEPLGPVPGLAGDTAVETPQGPCRISDLRCGDLVVTVAGECVPVLARLSRRVPARGAFRPVRLLPPYFGLTRELVVAPGQSLVVSGVDVSYLFGCDAVLVPAAALVNGRAAVFDDSGPLVTWHQALLPGHESMIAAGAGIESLYVGRLRRQRQLLEQTLLADVPPGLLPEHGGTSLKVLAPFEAVTLAESRAA